MQNPQIFLSSSGALVRFAGEVVLLVREETKTGGAVPPRGPLMRRLSVMLPALLASRQNLGIQNIGDSCLDLYASRGLIPAYLSPCKRQKAETCWKVL